MRKRRLTKLYISMLEYATITVNQKDKTWYNLLDLAGGCFINLTLFLQIKAYLVILFSKHKRSENVGQGYK